jgi:toxin ParE1/3/4
VRAPRIAFSDAALADILEQSDWYSAKAGRKLAKRWEEGVTSTLLRMAKAPGIGSLCEFSAEELRGTRRLSVAGFPRHLIFYQAREHEIFILRIVHGARDLESLFSERGSSKS